MTQRKDTKAYADCRLASGAWANVCLEHFRLLNCRLGLGYGQRFIEESSR